MARPLKHGLDYFPHDTDAASDPKVAAMKAVYGLAGYGFYFELLEHIYRENPAEIDVKDPIHRKVLAKSLGLSVKRFDKMLKTALQYGLFDATAYEERGVITSNGIQGRVGSVLAERERKREAYKQQVSARRNSGETPDTPPKGKERKGKETKEKDNDNDLSSAASSTPASAPRKAIPKATLEQQLTDLREPLPDGDCALVDEYLDLLAARNDSGKITLSRRVNQTRELIQLRDGTDNMIGLGPEAWRYGMQAAIRKEVAEINYIKRAAESWRPKKGRSSSAHASGGKTRSDGSEEF